MKKRTRRGVSGAPPDGFGAPGPSTPIQQDEADVLDELGAERDEETGQLVVDEETIKQAGALDTGTIRENRRVDEVVGKKRANQKNVPLNETDVLRAYETLIRVWGTNDFDIFVKRLTGSPIQTTIVTRPKSAAELYDVLLEFHGQHEEAAYTIDILDAGTRQYRGRDKRIVMPDTRPKAKPQGQPMQPPPYGYPPGYPPPGYPPGYPNPTGYPPPGYPPPGYPPQQAAPAAPAPAPGAPPPAPPPPIVHVQAPATPGVGDMVETLRQVYQLAQSMVPPPQPAAPVYAPPPPPAPVMMPPPPPPNADPAVLFAYTKQLLELVQQLTAARAAPTPMPAAPLPVAPAPQPVAPPSPQGPPGTIWIPQLGMHVPFDRLARALSDAPSGGNGPLPGGGGPGYGPPRAPAPGYGPPQYRGREDGRPPYAPYPQQQQPPRERSIADQFRESISVIRTVRNMAEEVGEMFPGREEPETPQAPPPPVVEDGPIKVMNVGGTQFAFDGESGGIRAWETGMLNFDRIAKAVNEHVIKPLQERQTPPRRVQLPPGYVEMVPGQEAPPGFIAVPIDQLPPPPQDLPPPVSAPASGHAPGYAPPPWSAPAGAIEGNGIG